MTDQLLTDAEIAAIAARAEAWREYKGRYGQFQREVNHDLLAADIPALLAHIRAQDAELARLRDALRDVCAAAEYVDPYEEGMDQCLLCNCWREDGHFKHDDDCPVGAARALLDAR